MFCRNYRKLGIDEDGNYVLDVELVSDTTPDPLPIDGNNIDRIPFDGDKVKFAPGSVLFAVHDNAVFVADESGEFQSVS